MEDVLLRAQAEGGSIRRVGNAFIGVIGEDEVESMVGRLLGGVMHIVDAPPPVTMTRLLFRARAPPPHYMDVLSAVMGHGGVLVLLGTAIPSYNLSDWTGFGFLLIDADTVGQPLQGLLFLCRQRSMERFQIPPAHDLCVYPMSGRNVNRHNHLPGGLVAGVLPPWVVVVTWPTAPQTATLTHEGVEWRCTREGEPFEDAPQCLLVTAYTRKRVARWGDYPARLAPKGLLVGGFRCAVEPPRGFREVWRVATPIQFRYPHRIISGFVQIE